MIFTQGVKGYGYCWPLKNTNQLLRIMKLVVFLTIVFSFHAFSESKAQKITLDVTNQSLAEVMREVRAISGYSFVFYSDRIANTRISVRLNNTEFSEAMQRILKGHNLSWSLADNIIAIRADKSPTAKPLRERLQEHVISGTVTNKTGAPLEGVTVTIQGASQRTTTNAAGFYRLVLPANNEANTLVFTSVGFETETHSIGHSTSINVSMKATIADLDEVVVVGYGTQKKASLTGAVSALNNQDFGRRQVGQSSLLLQGLAPGVTVTQRSGQPGRDAGAIRIRGNGTIGDNNPMILVDGVEMSMDNIDPETIESISVLKDAASAAIYGSRAANGVILVTTKRAKEGQTSMTYNGYYGIDNPTNLPEKVNAIDHMQYYDIAYVNSGRDPIFTNTLEAYRQSDGNDPDNFPDTDWMDLLLQPGQRQNHTLSFNKGYRNLTLAASFGYLKQEGIINNSTFDRLNFRLNSDVKISEKMTAKFDVLVNHVDRPEPISESANVNEVFFQMYRIPANQPAKFSNGLYGEGWAGVNPLQWTEAGGIQQLKSPTASLNFQFDYKPLSWLKATLVFAPIYRASHTKTFINALTTYNADGSEFGSRPVISSLRESYSRTLNKTLRGTIQAEKSVNNHYLKVMAGYSQEDYKNYSFSGYREGFQLPQYDVLDAGSQSNKDSRGSAGEWALLSLFGRINYDYKDTYLFEFTGRYDGSSRFAKNNRFAFFPSVSLGWRILSEPFMEPLRSAFDDLKIRASWGTLGNQNIGSTFYPYVSSVPLVINYTFGNRIASGARLLDLANEELKWEQTEMYNIGLDVTLKPNISFTVDYFQKKTTDILLTLNIPGSLGLRPPFQNAGSVSNKGWEFGLRHTGRIGGVNYRMTAAVSDVVNKIEDLKGISSTSLTQNREGYAMNSLYGFFADGYFQNEQEIENQPEQFGLPLSPGDIRYKDLNNDGKIDDNDRGIFGNTIPRFTYSLNLNLNYKQIDFGAFFQGVGKADGYLYSSAIMPFFNGGTMYETHKDYWTPENTAATFPRLAFNAANNQKNSNFWMRSAAYLRVKNIQLGYTIPSNAIEKLGIKSIRAYITGENLFTFDKFWKGFDVEAPVGTGSFYPQVKSYSLGLNVNF